MFYRYLQRQAHEQPVIFYSCVIGLIGPLIVVTVPPIRKSMGWQYAERLPTTYPGMQLPISLAPLSHPYTVPNRPRVQLTGYDD
ncbi:hypothetical protein PHLCEN_2v8084 [Hermanssonia centrifuga]|uniref:NADH-ubiquinone oxidoreductase 9.5 kDa subunit n=1 Tax=Hermanssonia centrifuga TaxID=98765 RepID=A0A2R6NUS0_9APHY|nr:hypothetical protein PHLCEN_2v8084 [Hermanssonia centrifuga]